jgi:uncharacterized protein (DUF1697 family)
MTRWVALLRGMNIGGNRLPVADLRAAAESIGANAVRSYLASGNLVFDAEGEARDLATALEGALAARGLRTPALVLPGPAFAALVAACPFEPEEGRHVHAFLLWSDPQMDEASLATLRAPTEALVVEGRVAWLHAPEGIGRSRLVEKLHTVLRGTAMTARNLNTLRALAEMVDAGAPG